jgi:hypothetical protein
MALARAYEQRLALTNDVPAKHPSSRATPARPSPKTLSLPTASSTVGTKEATATPTPTAPRLKRLTAAEMAAKREKRECYNCSEKFSQEHLKICPMKGIYLLQMDDAKELTAPDGDELRTSLNAITGISPVATMRLVVRINTATVTTLVDSGSTHSFISEVTTRRLHLHPSPRPGLHVTVVNGDWVASVSVYGVIHFFIDREEFITDLFVIPLDGHEMVLRVHWLRTLGPILWDFDHACISYWWDDHRVVWQGVPSQRDPTVAVHATAASDLMDMPLQEYTVVFDMPIRLPPPHRHNHHIHLLSDTPPVAVRPYRYPQLVKDELERQCRDMLDQGIIRPSSSAFSSPVLLVKKHNGTLRFCVDYRALNTKTVRDAFAIPVVDELRGARFTKLDLCSGYHQVRMNEADVKKTAFRTHQGHFEFLVMPFGLTNAPATFQALMNDALQDFIRDFIIVFFDDILIYSDSWSTHLRHVRAVLDRLCEHKLAVKRSKCSFDASSMGYLSHVISTNGVHDKVATV